MHKIIVSIFPSYLCNNNCNFCYLYNCHDNTLLDLDLLEKRLEEIKQYFEIHKFNLYGGEITLLDKAYLIRLNDIIEKNKAPNYLTSNLYDIDKLMIFKNAILSTSLNLERPDYKYIRSKLKENLFDHISVLSMITPSILNMDSKEVLDSYNRLNIEWLSFIKYYPSINTGDVFNIKQEDYEQKLKDLTIAYLSNKYDYKLGHIAGLDMCIKREYPIATNDQCIRIGPDGRFGAIYYDENNLENFKWYNTIDEYIIDCEKERQGYRKKCGFCKYYGNCWTEHITNLKCDGCKELLDWWSNYE